MKLRNKQNEEGILKVVHDDKVKTLLSNLDMLNDVQEGKIKCNFCKEIITLDSINGIFPESNIIKITCNKPTCVIQLTEYLNDYDV